MRIEQDLHQRPWDHKWEVWQLLPVVWRSGPEAYQSLASGNMTQFVLLRDEWVLAGTFSSKDNAIRFWNASYLAAQSATTPLWAGDGFGASGLDSTSASDHLSA